MKQRLTSRFAPAVVALLILAACGDGDSSSAPPGSDPAPPATDGRAGAALRPPTPVEVVGGGADGASRGASASSATADAAESGAATSGMLIAPWIAEYVVDDGLPALPGDDTGYVYDSSTEVSVDQVAALAAALGVSGDPVRVDDGFGESWRVGPDDGSAPSLWVSGDGMQSWNYNAPWDEGVVQEACAVSVDADGNESGDCPEPEPPVGVPTPAEAEQRARELLAAFGVDADSLTFEVFGDEWFASVSASDGRDDRNTIRSWHFGFGGAGVLQFAGGSLAEPQPVGPYPLVDVSTAVSRLSEGYLGGFGGGGVAVAEPAIAVEGDAAAEPVIAEPVEPSEPVVEGDQGDPGDADGAEPAPPPDETPDETPDEMPDEPVEPFVGEPVVVTLVDVVPDLWWAWDADGSVWLLPAYRFIDTEGGWHTVPAVVDEFLVVVEPPMLDEPVPVEPDGGIGDGGEPIPDPEPLPTKPPGPEPDVPPPDVPDAIDEEPAPDTADALALLEQFVGLSIEEFTAEAGTLGFDTRIVMQDGQPLAVTADYSETRVNVAVEGPRVVAIESIG